MLSNKDIQSGPGFFGIQARIPKLCDGSTALLLNSVGRLFQITAAAAGIAKDVPMTVLVRCTDSFKVSAERTNTEDASRA